MRKKANLLMKSLTETLSVLEKIKTSDVVCAKFPTVLLEEQIARLKGARQALENYSTLLKSYEKRELTKENAEECLVLVHSNLMSFVNDIDQIDELLTEVLSKIPD